MRIAVPHHTTKENARRIVEERLATMDRQYSQYTADLQKQWNGDRLDVSGKARGFSVNAWLEITDSEVIVDGKLPLIAKPFESRIRNTVEKEAEAMFPKG